MNKKKIPAKKNIVVKVNDNSNTEPKKKENSVESILRTFKDNLHSVDFFFRKFGDIAENEDEGAMNTSFEYIKEAFTKVGIQLDNEKEEQNSINEDKLEKLAKILKKKPKFSVQNFNILSSSSFLMLNNYFEYLIADLLSYHYNKYKDTLNSKEFKVSLKEMAEYETIEDLEKHLILKEVETLLVELSFDGLLNHFKTKFNISLNEDIINWDIINECRERRHLIVHNASIINKKYITRTNNPENKKIGDKITIDKEYFQKVFNEIKLAGLLLSYECWGSWEKDKATKAIRDMLDESFENLLQNNIASCDKITAYISKIEARNEEQEDFLMRAKFNRSIALKKQSKKTELNKILATIKVGTSTPLFKLAHAVLSEKNDNTILELIDQSNKLNDIDFDSYSEWPLFEFIRDKKELNEKIVEKLKN